METLSSPIFVEVKKLDEDAIIPEYQTEGAACFDIHALIKDGFCEVIDPGETKIINTGLCFGLPDGYEMQIRPRSGLAAKYNITVLNSPGTLDQDYIGELKIILINLGNKIFRIESGDRIAQGCIKKVDKVFFSVVENLKETERGDRGFGSTGIK